ncbi:MAG: UDP binding domain-containing protein [Methanoregula sp.]|jgi:UDP-N-acetyl-D-mannosaminuronate dehydrogenase|nr:UDP binding domain-containing protein [Methanoregula sp.]
MVHERKEYDVNVYGYDPLLSNSMIKYFGVNPLPNMDTKMDAVIIAVAHKQFKEMSVEKIRSLMDDHPVLVDVRGMVDRDAAEKAGMFYRKL